MATRSRNTLRRRIAAGTADGGEPGARLSGGAASVSVRSLGASRSVGQRSIARGERRRVGRRRGRHEGAETVDVRPQTEVVRRGAQGLAELSRRCEALVAVARKGAIEHRRERGERREERDGLHLAEGRALTEALSRRVSVGADAGEHLAQHRRRREEVGPRVDLLASRLFGRHVGELAHHRPRVRRRRGARPGRVRDAEVRELHFSRVPEQDVVRGDVAVHEAQRVAARRAQRVDVPQGVEERLDDGERDPGRKAAAVGAAQQRGEVAAVD